VVRNPSVSGALRHLHVTALFGLIVLSLTLPGAFTDDGLNTRSCCSWPRTW
jgi:hypothetical protein